MPIIDSQLLLSDQQQVLASGASTNTIDFGATGTPVRSSVPLVRDLGRSTIPLMAQVTNTFTGLTSLQMDIQTSPDGSTWTSVWTSGAIPVASLVKGYQFHVEEVPFGASARYMRANYTVVGTGTAGNVSCGITMGLQTNGQF